MKKLRIGLLVDDPSSCKPMYELASWARQQTMLEISHLIVNSRERSNVNSGSNAISFRDTINRRISSSAFNLVVRLERAILSFSRSHRDRFDSLDLRTLIEQQVTVHPIFDSGSGNYQYSELDVKRVRSLDLDLIIRHGSGRIAGEILRTAHLGIIAYRSVAARMHTKDSSCFWECYQRDPKTGFAIQTLTDAAASARTLLSGFFATNFCFSLNQTGMYQKSGPHLQDLLKRIAVSGELPSSDHQAQGFTSTDRPPSALESIHYLLKFAYRLSKKLIYRAINFQRKWGLSFAQSSWRDVHTQPRYDAIAPKGHFWADPFVYAHKGKTYCFIEDYVYQTGLGHIAVLEVANGEAIHLGDCLKEPFHLSFPFLFQYEGVLYMCPEASASRKIQLYRCIEFPLQWQASVAIMEDVAAADSMLFAHDGRWWMLTSIDRSGSNDFTSELYLFHAETPLSQNWKAHPANPIYIDSEGGRNAGLIVENGKIFRLAQRQGFDQYGEGLLMFEVTELTEVTYKERKLPRMNPPLSKGQIGTHHLSTTGAVTVFDHVSRAFAQ